MLLLFVMKQKTNQSDKMKKKIPLIESNHSKTDLISKSKGQLKKDLILQLSDLQNEFNALKINFEHLEGENKVLVKTNNENLELIESLKREVLSFKKDKQSVPKRHKLSVALN